MMETPLVKSIFANDRPFPVEDEEPVLQDLFSTPLVSGSRRGDAPLDATPYRRAIPYIQDAQGHEHKDQYGRPISPTLYAHAPKGGVTIKGKFFKGGEFIPAEVLVDASPEERRAVESGESRGKPLPPEGGVKEPTSPQSWQQVVRNAPEDKPVGSIRDDKKRMQPSITHGLRNNCFNNAAEEYAAQLKAGNDPKYVIGIVYPVYGRVTDLRAPTGRGFQHAWVEVGGRVVDPTLLTERNVDATKAYHKVEYSPIVKGGPDLNPNQPSSL